MVWVIYIRHIKHISENMTSLVVPENCIDKSIQKIIFSFICWWHIALLWIHLFKMNWHIGMKQKFLWLFKITNLCLTAWRKIWAVCSMFSVAFMYSIIWVFIVKRQTWNGKTVEEEGCSYWGLKSYCPIVMGIRKGEILINGEQIYRQTVKKIYYIYFTS